MIRAFIAISIPDRILQKVKTVTYLLKELRLDARFTKTSSMHLTLKFLGDIDEVLVDTVGEVLDQCVGMANQFTLDIERLGVFPNIRRPRIVWVGVREEPLLIDLQRQVDRKLQRLGFNEENRPFKPHLTLARVKSLENLADFRRFLATEGNSFRIGSFEVDAIHLYQSILRPDGAEYRRLSSHVLEKGTGAGS